MSRRPAAHWNSTRGLGAFAVLIAMTFFGAGCSCGGPQSFCQQVAELQCDHEIACGSTLEEYRGTCVEQRATTICGRNPEDVEKGLKTFDQKKADACLNEARTLVEDCDAMGVMPGYGLLLYYGPNGSWESSTCRGTRPPQPEQHYVCQEVFSGASPAGGPCVDQTDCSGTNARCDQTTCQGECKPAGTLGGRCTNGCDTGLQCDSRGWLCEPARATSPGDTCSLHDEPCAPGQICLEGACSFPANEGEACQDYLGCRDDLRCAGGVCQPRLPEGAPCRQSGTFRDEYYSCIQCEVDLQCDLVTGLCALPGLALEGDPCTGSATGCAGNLFCQGAWVNPDGGTGTVGTCERPALRAPCSSTGECPEGAFCRLGEDGGAGICAAAVSGTSCDTDSNCPPDLRCDLHRYVCAPPGKEGDECGGLSPFRQCERGLRCFPYGRDDGTCIRPPELGEKCDPEIACRSPLVCAGGECRVPTAREGDACSDTVACMDGRCDDGRCHRLVQTGKPCSLFAACESGRCISGICTAACL